MICISERSSISVIENNYVFVGNMWINGLQKRIKNNLRELLPNKEANIAIAFLLGDSEILDSEQRATFSNASLSHILAISGMHVTYVMIAIGIISKKIGYRRGKYFVIIFLVFFAMFTGNSPSVVRAVIMCSLVIISKLAYRKSDSINSIAVACLFILIINPYYILNLGFQLSFIGTLGIIMFNERLKKIVKKYAEIFIFKLLRYSGKVNSRKAAFPNELYIENIQNNSSEDNSKIQRKDVFINIIESRAKRLFKSIGVILITSISANIFIFPILVYSFNTISFVFLVSNLLVTPILGLMSLFGYLTVIISLISIKIAGLLSIILRIFIQIIDKISTFCSNIVRFTVVTPNVILIFFYYFLVFYLLFYYNRRHNKFISKCIVGYTIISIIFNTFFTYNPYLVIHFIDVGQGDSTLIITSKNKTILIDGGGSENSSYDIGERLLVPYLLDRGVNSIDYMIFSHFDSDHCKGLFSVIEKLKVENAIISNQGEISSNYIHFLELAKEKKVNIIRVKAGNRINFDQFTYLDILWPEDTLISENILNNNSIVCKLSYGNTSVLFTGDIEKAAEERIIKKYGKLMLNSTILKVAHHGSKSSSTQDFVSFVNPRIALIGVGEKNKFGHPNEYVISRFEKNGTRIYRTDRDGEISIKIKKDGYLLVNTEINSYRCNYNF